MYINPKYDMYMNTKYIIHSKYLDSIVPTITHMCKLIGTRGDTPWRLQKPCMKVFQVIRASYCPRLYIIGSETETWSSCPTLKARSEKLASAPQPLAYSRSLSPSPSPGSNCLARERVDKARLGLDTRACQ